ncbi:hypothetical protein MJO28_000491 [Puccinia striiformis f. sp. tritici]|uniref:Uncharacterized protein n=3 Tax=Puccinia striiformis TaxID=27350 RepID=A0A0L0URN4_9BASI|nr:hypothetical protein Pst134EB_001953 [Puccinia striiformis f. sp. tritici]KAI7962397.1 hypothetical protein MJO28_000491 [Puccinia striiformis f. sp. tritici]KNE89738.1 hypothetical protein PSTG_16807 [Puccinia striiformis f. sp. tritici PST-78]POW14934.1 hypothetical protein PSTT_02495 [Puccinia striiformis]
MDAPLMMIWIATISIISFSFSTASPLNRRPLCSLGGGASHFYSALRPVSVELPKSQMTAAADFARPRPLPRKPLTRLKSSRLKPSRRNSAAVSKLKISQLSRDPSVTKIEEIRDVPYTSRQAQTNSEKNIEPPSQAEAPHNQESLGSFERLKDIPKNQNWCRALGQFFKRIKSKFVNLFELLLMNIKRTFRNSHAPSQSEAQSAGEVQTNAAYTEPEGAVQELLAPSKPETSGKEVPAFHQTTTSDVSSPTPPGWRLATLPSYVFNYFCDQAKSHMPGHLIPSFLQNPEPEKVSESCRKLVSKVPSPKPVEKSLLPNNDLKVQKELERFIHATIQPLIQEIVTPEDTRELLAAIRTESNPIYRWVMNMIPDATAHNLMMNILMPDAVKGASRWSAEKIMSTVSDFAAKRKAIHN